MLSRSYWRFRCFYGNASCLSAHPLPGNKATRNQDPKESWAMIMAPHQQELDAVLVSVDVSVCMNVARTVSVWWGLDLLAAESRG